MELVELIDADEDVVVAERYGARADWEWALDGPIRLKCDPPEPLTAVHRQGRKTPHLVPADERTDELSCIRREASQRQPI